MNKKKCLQFRTCIFNLKKGRQREKDDDCINYEVYIESTFTFTTTIVVFKIFVRTMISLYYAENFRAKKKNEPQNY